MLFIPQLLDLLLSFNRVPDIRSVVYDRMLDYVVCVRSSIRSHRTDPMLALMSWTRRHNQHSTLSSIRDSSLLALDLIFDIYEVRRPMHDQTNAMCFD